ncbi:MAG: GAF domain-containing protein, partial [Dermatophilaceae bacterium]
MPARRYARTSLATRYTLLASLVAAFTTVLLGVSSAVGVYQMASAEQTARQEAYAEIVVREITGRLQASYRVLLTLSERDALESDDAPTARRALANVMVDNAEYLERVLLAESSGTVVAVYPTADDLDPATITALTTASDSTHSVFVWRPDPDGTDDDVLWAVAPTPKRDDGTRRYLLAQIRTQALSTTLEQVSTSDRDPTAYIVDGQGVVQFAAGDSEAIAAAGNADFSVGPDQRSGDVQTSSRDGARYVGVWADVTGLAGVDWRVVVLETADVAARETGRALQPAMVAWGVSVLLSVALAIAGFSWLARPLRTLESRARAAAAGAILEPIAVARGDEVGRLLESFNLITMRLNRMHDVSQILARSSDRDEVLDGIVSSMGHMLGATDVDVLLLDDSGDIATLVRALGTLSGRSDVRVELAGSGWLRETLHSGDAEMFSGAAVDDVLMSLHASGKSAPSGLAVPLAKGVDVLGIVAIVSERQRTFSAAEVELARSFAAQASVALDNARLFDEERRSRREAETLRDVAESLTQSRDLRGVLESSARTEADLLGVDVSFVALVS